MYYGWVIVAVSYITLFFSVGLRNSFGVFFIAILHEYGWGRAETAGAFSLAMIAHALFAPVTGTLVDRFGPRMLFPFGAILLIIGLVACSFIAAIWHLYLFFGVFVAVGINTLSYAPHMSIIPKWFIRKRGLAIGIVLAGIGMGTMFILPLVEYLIGIMGWRSAYLVLAGIVLCVVVPCNALLQRRSPREVGQHPDGIAPDSKRPPISSKAKCPPPGDDHFPPGGWSLKAALSTSAFRFLFLTTFTNGFLINLLLVHQAIHMVDIGYSEMLAASLVGMVSLLGSLSGIGYGFVSDRIGRETGYTIGNGLAFSGLLFLLFMRDTSSTLMLYAFVFLYGIGYGAIPPMTASATGDLFPGNALGRILAMQSIGFGMGAALGAYAGGCFYDQMKSYEIPFVLLLFSIVLGVLGIWLAAPRRMRYRRSSLDFDPENPVEHGICRSKQGPA